MIQKDCNIWVHLIHTSKLWDKYKVENKKECIYNIDKKIYLANLLIYFSSVDIINVNSILRCFFY